ncbi:MAG TPA: methyltransferase [Xanthobacteraceae bacterium]|jgi:tRNA1(Val) A37 N6-methylase TrmN6|nr:methyltransferase [Xanthobacteraceae bacterium]
MPAETAETSEDAVLGGRLMLRQPLRGHRVGHDAILLAAAASARSGEHAVDLGSGVGGAGLALARRIAGVAVTLVEIDPELAALAAGNVQRNGLSGRVRAVRLDVDSSAADFIAAGLAPGSVACVLMNPPFNVAQQPSPDPARRLAHAASEGTLERWLRAAARLLHADGVVTLIWRADGLADVLAALGKDFGPITVLPVHPKPGAAAIRVLVRATKGSRAPLKLLPGLLLAETDGKPTAAAEAVLRKGEALSLTEN